jgi:hypothetical protein
LILIVSVGLLGYSWLILQMEKAQKARQEGDIPRAASLYARAEKPFYVVPGLPHVLRGDYKNVSLGQVSILYEQNQSEDAFQKLEQISTTAPFVIETGEYAFWTGNLLFRRALQTKDPETSVNSAKAALAEYQKGLAAEPGDWDLKYNFELLSHIFLQKERDQKKEQQKVKSILDKMRPTVEPSREDLAPEKRG